MTYQQQVKVSLGAFAVLTLAFAINLWRMIFPHRVRYATPPLFTSKRNWKEVLALESEIIEKEKERMAAAKKERMAKEVQNI